MLKLILKRLPSAVVTLVLLPVVAGEYFSRDTGKTYGIRPVQKLTLLFKMVRNNFRVPSASSFIYHLLMAAKIMNVPSSGSGVIVECGCFMGGSTVNLSLVAALCGRRLHVFDSFAGLPAPTEQDSAHRLLADGTEATYSEGAYVGSKETVVRNLRRYGDFRVCELHEGFFEQTLPDFSEPVVFAYLDVDLVSSLTTCLQHLWPKLIPGGFIFTDEADHMEMAGMFFDRRWWEDQFGADPPGLVGGGNGIGLFLSPGGFRSSLGYTAKIPSGTLPRRPG